MRDSTAEDNVRERPFTTKVSTRCPFRATSSHVQRYSIIFNYRIFLCHIDVILDKICLKYAQNNDFIPSSQKNVYLCKVKNANLYRNGLKDSDR